MHNLRLFRPTLALVTALVVGACSPSSTDPEDILLTLAAYSAPREAFERDLIPSFAADFYTKTNKRIRIKASYLASGAQSRAVVGGFEADVVALALAPDVDRIAEAKLISHDWRQKPHGGMFTSTVVAFAVRTGNPQKITDWSDLARPGISLLIPNPKTSGGAMWNGSALYGAALRGHAGVPQNDVSAAQDYLYRVLKNVAILDKGARESVITFEKGVGDVAVTYESEIVAGNLAGRIYDKIIPPSTLLIEIPAAVVDVYASKHGVLSEAEAFVEFLHSPPAQRILARHGFRSIDSTHAVESESAFPKPEDLWTIDALGGWQKVKADLYGPSGLFSRTWETVYAAP